ncbi:MAG: redoxin domain-containing protein [Dehalococcoidia bacterium]
MESVAPPTPVLRQPAIEYRFEHPRLSDIVHDMFIRHDELGPGDQIPAFDMPTTEGGRFSSSQLAAMGVPTLIVFGSRSCPVTESGADGLVGLHERFGRRIRFVMVQVREAHPGDSIVQPRTAEEKWRHASALKRRYRLPFEVAVDDVDGTLHRALATRPNSAFVIDPGGTILVRVQWANETEAIGDALEAIVRGQAPPLPTISHTLSAMTRTMGFMSAALDAAGPGARLDTWKVAPPMALMMHAADVFFFLPREKRGLPAMALVTALVLGVAAAVFRAWA